jgi:outer membrane protein assembly factor BamB
MRRPIPWAIAFAAALLAATATAAGDHGTAAATSSRSSDRAAISTATAPSWPQPEGDLGATRLAASSSIDSSNVASLAPAWRTPLTGGGTFGDASTTPIVVRGQVYLEDLSGRVRSIDLRTGKVAWTTDLSVAHLPMIGPNGVAVDGGKVFAIAGRGDVAALDARTGAVRWRTTVTDTSTLGVDIQPIVYEHRVYVSTVPVSLSGIYHGGDAGSIVALDESTGAIDWTFDTVADDLWGNPTVNSGGGAWYPPSIDPSTGLMYWGIGNPAPFPGAAGYPDGSSRPGPDLYTDSTIALDVATGALRWYSQATPHDLFDLDHQLTMAVPTSGGTVVIGTGKDGYVYGLDPLTGRTRWRRRVGKHHNDRVQSFVGSIKVFPGEFGGVETPPAAADGVVYVALLNEPTTYQPASPGFGGTIGTKDGEVVAIDATDGSVLWDVSVPGDPLGGATVAGDLVFTGLQDGRLLALSRTDGSTVWSYQTKGVVNAWPAIVGNTVVWPLGGESPPQVLALRLGSAP